MIGNMLLLSTLVMLMPMLLPAREISHFKRSLQDENIKEMVNRVLDTVPLVDGHNDLPNNLYKLVKNQLSLVDLRQNLTLDPEWGRDVCASCHTDIPRLRAGKVGAQFWSAYVVCDAQYKDATERTLEQIDVIHRLVDKYNDVFQLVTSAQEILDAFAAGKIGSLIGVEGGHSMDSRLAVLRVYYQLGVRYLTLTHKCSTPWADSSSVDDPGFEPVHDGITEFGKLVINEMNRLGMLIDLAHVSKQTQIDVIAESKAPVIFSHSSVFAICESSRNVHDDVLALVKENNGIVMINFYNKYISCSDNATIHDIVKHIQYVRRLIGVDYVGIGSDFDGVKIIPEGLEDVSKYPDLFALLATDPLEPWSEDELRKLAGLNLIRVMQQVEQVRDQLASSNPNEDIIPESDLGNNTQCMTPPVVQSQKIRYLGVK